MNPIAETLNHLLADYQVLYQKLRNFHWNVKGPMFFELHAKFEELYTEAATRVDDLAERVLALKHKPLSTLRAQLEAARLKEDAGAPDAKQMVQTLVDDYGALNSRLREAAGVAEKANDRATLNLLDGIADGQEKTVWMLRSYLQQ